MCREGGLHGGAELSCCGLQAFDPTAATCCKVDFGNEVRGTRICFQGFLKEMKRGRKQKTKSLTTDLWLIYDNRLRWANGFWEVTSTRLKSSLFYVLFVYSKSDGRSQPDHIILLWVTGLSHSQWNLLWGNCCNQTCRETQMLWQRLVGLDVMD